MVEIKETCFNCVDKDDYAVFSSSEKRWINKILKMHEKYPDKVQIVHYPENNYGTIYAYIPKKWLKLSPPRQVNYTDEQKAAMAKRLAAARNKQTV